MVPEKVILVNEQDEPIGEEEKLRAHRLGLLHRAFSVFIFNPLGELLIQKRALCKYHSPGLWANSCCSHPRWGESNMAAANRRLQEELGLSTPLHHIGHLTYNFKLNNELSEHEYTHLFIGHYQGEMAPNPDEVSQIQWKQPAALRDKVLSGSAHYGVWFEAYLTVYYSMIFGKRRKG